MSWSRRDVLSAAACGPLAALTACAPGGDRVIAGGWVGQSHERGHRLRDLRGSPLPAPDVHLRTDVLVVGAGIAGLACARTLVQSGIEDVRVLELEDETGGNSRGHRMGAMTCPLGAHYLPLPGDPAVEVIELLEAWGIRRTVQGRARYDERQLCHSPQERLFIDGHWRDGLLAPLDALPRARQAETLADYRRFSRLVEEWRADGAFTIPTARCRWRPGLSQLDAVSFAQWLDHERLAAPALRWYLDYCCRDDYGGGAAQVSAWAGLHYFASRHGFLAPGDGEDDRDAVLTWPEGNAHLAARLAEPLAPLFARGRIALRVVPARHSVQVDAWDAGDRRLERWTAQHVVLATPLFVSSRLLESPPPALAEAATQMRYAPWLVTNLQLDAALDDRPGAPLSWDNVIYGSPSLGYVDAMHQSTRPYDGPTVLTGYWSWGTEPGARQALLALPWRERLALVLRDLAVAHPDLPQKVVRADLMRYGHAMSIPVPGVRSSPALASLAVPAGRVGFAHSDLSAYSVFEEAIFHGVRAARAVAQVMRDRSSEQ